jgi:hypothetical protein
MIKSGFVMWAASRIDGAAEPYQTDVFTPGTPSV